MENLERRIKKLNDAVGQSNSYLCAITIINGLYVGLAVGYVFLKWI